MRRKLLILLSVLFIASSVYAAQVVRLAPLTYSVKSTSVTVTTTATKLPTTPLAGRESVAIRLNSTTDVVFIGADDVTAVAGFRLDSSVPAITLDLDSSVDVYGITSSGSADCRVLEAK